MRVAALVLCLTACATTAQPPRPLTADERAPSVIVGAMGAVYDCGPARWVLEEQWYVDRDCTLRTEVTRRRECGTPGPHDCDETEQDVLCSRRDVAVIHDDDPALPMFRKPGRSEEDAKFHLAVERANGCDWE